MTFTVQIDVSAVVGRLRALSDLSFLPPAMDSIASDLSAEVSLGFKAQSDPWGASWTPLKPSTIRARRKGKGSGSAQILRDTGVLQNSITARRTGPLSIEIGTTTPYAAIHQFGGAVEHAARSIRVRLRKTKNANGKTVSRFAKDKHKRATEKWGEAKAWRVVIPARPFLPIRNGVVDLPSSWDTAIKSRIRAAFGGVSA